MATSEGIPSSIDIEFLELNDNPYYNMCDYGIIWDKNSGFEPKYVIQHIINFL